MLPVTFAAKLLFRGNSILQDFVRILINILVIKQTQTTRKQSPESAHYFLDNIKCLKHHKLSKAEDTVLRTPCHIILLDTIYFFGYLTLLSLAMQQHAHQQIMATDYCQML